MKVNMDINLRNVQEQVEENVGLMRQYAYKAALAYVGMFGLAYDAAKSSVDSGTGFVDKAEKRGEELEREFNEQFGKYREQFMEEAKKIRSRMNEGVDGVGKTLPFDTDSIEQEIEKLLARIGIGGHEDVETKVVEVTMAAEDAVNAAAEALAAPFEGYEELNVREIMEKFDGMDESLLMVVREYEAATKNRVTILREIDERLEAKESVVA